MRKILLVISLILGLSVLLVGCGGSSSSKGYGDLFRDKAAIKKAVDDIKKMGGGTPLNVFQSMHFGPEFINFSRQDPKKPENVDNFIWNPNGGWQGPKVVKLRGDGDLKDNVFDIDEVNWDAIPDFVAEVEKMAKEKGLEKASLGSSIMINFSVRSQKLTFSASIKGERKDASATGDIKTGKVTDFRMR